MKRRVSPDCKAKDHANCAGKVDRGYDEPHDHDCECKCHTGEPETLITKSDKTFHKYTGTRLTNP